jgi:hypothetical protein
METLSVIIVIAFILIVGVFTFKKVAKLNKSNEPVTPPSILGKGVEAPQCSTYKVIKINSLKRAGITFLGCNNITKFEEIPDGVNEIDICAISIIRPENCTVEKVREYCIK